jgi:hypothetical protein
MGREVAMPSRVEIAKAPASIDVPQTPGRALVAVAAPEGTLSFASSGRATCRPLAHFLAHLIATKRGMPQTRERRRAAPDFAAGAYVRAAQRTPSSAPFERKI